MPLDTLNRVHRNGAIYAGSFPALRFRPGYPAQCHYCPLVQALPCSVPITLRFLLSRGYLQRDVRVDTPVETVHDRYSPDTFAGSSMPILGD